jgi:hypothetical protein
VPGFCLEETLVEGQLRPERQIVFGEIFQQLFAPSDWDLCFRLRFEVKCQESKEATTSLANISSLLSGGGLVRLECGERSWAVHSGLLARQSPVLAACLQSGMSESLSHSIQLQQDPPEAVEALVLFLYGHPPSSASPLQPLMRLAHRYQMEPLVQLVSQLLAADLSSAKGHSLLALATQLSLHWLQAECGAFIAAHSLASPSASLDSD